MILGGVKLSKGCCKSSVTCAVVDFAVTPVKSVVAAVFKIPWQACTVAVTAALKLPAGAR